MFVALTFAIAAISQPAGPKAAVDAEPRYAAFWLTELKRDSAYPKLLIAKRPFGEMAKTVNLFERDEVPLFERWGLVITTYRKDEIFNTDMRPIKPLTRFGALNEKERTVEANGIRYRYEECPLGDAVRLLKGQTGKERISRIHLPLTGMEETARALRLLLAAQLKEDEAKKK
jgi:hypothetical protein